MFPIFARLDEWSQTHSMYQLNANFLMQYVCIYVCIPLLMLSPSKMNTFCIQSNVLYTSCNDSCMCISHGMTAVYYNLHDKLVVTQAYNDVENTQRE